MKIAANGIGQWVFVRLVVAVAIAMLISGSYEAAHAATLDIADGDVAGLIAAIATANGNSEDDVINLAVAGTYTLNAVHNTYNGPSGLPLIGSDNGHGLQINGNNSTLTRNAAAPDLRLLYIDQGANVMLDSLTLSGGKASGVFAGGGAMVIDGATVEAASCIITGNSAAGVGGAIYCNGVGSGNHVSLRLTSCTLSNNTANPSTGGAIFSNGSSFGSAALTLENCTVTDNYATQYGGAIYSDGSVFGTATATLDRCTVTGNTTENDGGAIHSFGDSGSATLSLTNCTLSSNKALHGYGGGIYSTGTSGIAAVTLTRCALNLNEANTWGGGVYVYANSGMHTLDLTECAFSGNSAVAGGGIYNDGSVGTAQLTVTRCTLSGNSGTSSGGGGIYNSGSFGGSANATIVNSTFASNTATAGSNGGAVYNDGYSGAVGLNLLNCTFSGNDATAGGDVYNDGDSGTGATVELANTIFAGGSGGSLYDFNSAGTITSQGHNISQDSAAGFLTAAGDQPSTDPELDTAGLLNNGGYTKTIALLPGSPARNAGDNTLAPATDQRGVARPQDGTVDIGAVEERVLSISGYVRTSGLAPIAGATVTATPSGSGPPATTTTSATGAYAVSGLPEGVYTVSVSLTDFSFVPATQGLRLTSANRGANFIGARTSPTYSISGRISDAAGAALVNVSVDLIPATGGVVIPVATNSAGYYTFSNLPDNTYTITPALGGTLFTPPNRSVTVAGTSMTSQNFSGTTGHKLSGRVMTSAGAAIEGVTVTRNGAGSTPVTTNTAGYYTFVDVPDGSITITPGKSGYIFTPVNKVVVMSGADVTGQNFIGATGYSVSGRIATSAGLAIAGVTVQLDGGATVITNSAGYYTFTGIASGQHTLVPGKTNYSFVPGQKTVDVNGANLSGQNFTGTGP